MKNKFLSRIAAMGVALVLAFVIVQACGKPEDLTKDVKLSVDNDLIRVPLVVQFLDPSVTASGASADAQLHMQHVKIKVKFIGTNIDKLFTTTGRRLTTLTEIEGGQLDIAVKKTDIVGGNVANGIKFSMILEAPNYLRTLRSFSINDTFPRFETVSMVNLASAANSAQGVAIKTATNVMSVTNGAVTVGRDVIVSDSAKVNIPAGTILKDKDGNNLSGNLNVQLVQFSPSDPLVAAEFLGSSTPTELKNENGASLGLGYLTNFGAFSLDMDVNGTPVKQFGGNPISVTVDISPNLRNPNTGQPIQVGQVVPIWSLNETTGEWHREGTGTISGTATSPKITFTQTHLSDWRVAQNTPVCKASQTLILPNNLSPTSRYTIQVVNANTNESISLLTWFLKSNDKLVLKDIPSIEKAYVRIKEFAFESRARSCRNRELPPAINTDVFNPCNLSEPFQLTATVAPSSPAPTMVVEASGTCASNPNVVIKPTLTVWYRPSTCKVWAPVGEMTNGKLSTSVISKGATYDFQVVVNGQVKQYLNQTIPERDTYVFPNIAFPEDFCKLLF